MSVQLKSWFFSNVRGLNARGKYINFNDESEPDTITFQALLDTSVLKRASTNLADYQDQASYVEINNRTIDRFVTSNQLPNYAIVTDADGAIFTVTKANATTNDNTINAGNQYTLSYNRPTATDLTDRTMTNLVSARNLPQTSYNVNGTPITGQSVDYITVNNSTLGTGTYGRFLSYNIQVKPLTTDYISYAGALLTDTIAGINTSLGNYVTTTAFNASQEAQDNVIATKLTGLSITAGTGTKITVNANGLVTGYANAVDSDITNTSDATGTKVKDALSWLKGVTDSLTSSVSGKQNSSTNLTSLSGLTYVSSALVRMSGINTFTLDTNTYLQSGTLTTNYILKYNGTNVVNSNIFDNGTNVGIGTASPNTYALVDFNSSTQPVKIPVILTANQPSASNIQKGGFMYNDNLSVIQFSDGVNWNIVGNLYGVSLTSNRVLRWNGTNAVNSVLQDDGTDLFIPNTALLKLNTTLVGSGASLRSLVTINGKRFICSSEEEINYGNLYVGKNAGNLSATTASYITAIGDQSLPLATSDYTTALGNGAGLNHTNGAWATYIGAFAGKNNSTGARNVYIGFQAGQANNGSDNVILGTRGVFSSSGFSNAIIIGSQADGTNIATNKLYIDSLGNAIPLIGGDFNSKYVAINGAIVAGTTTPNARAILHLQANNKGFLPPVLTTTERDNVSWVAGDAGMIIYNSTLSKHQGWDGTTWNNLY